MTPTDMFLITDPDLINHTEIAKLKQILLSFNICS